MGRFCSALLVQLHSALDIWLESPVRKVREQAKVTQCIHPEVVGVAGHFGRWAEGSPIQKGKGCEAPMRTTDRYRA